MRDSQAIVERISRLSRSLVRLELTVDSAFSEIRAGQYLLARPQSGWEPYLREVWFPIGKDDGLLTVECPPSDAYVPGYPISILGPAGRAMDFEADMRHILLIAHNHVPSPLYLFATQALEGEMSVTMVMDRDTDYPLGALPAEVEVIWESDWKWPDKVAALKWADIVVALATLPERDRFYMYLADVVRQIRNGLPRGFLFGIFAEPLICGVGACGVCTVTGRKRPLITCTDGPALDLYEVRL